MSIQIFLPIMLQNPLPRGILIMPGVGFLETFRHAWPLFISAVAEAPGMRGRPGGCGRGGGLVAGQAVRNPLAAVTILKE